MISLIKLTDILKPSCIEMAIEKSMKYSQQIKQIKQMKKADGVICLICLIRCELDSPAGHNAKPRIGA